MPRICHPKICSIRNAGESSDWREVLPDINTDLQEGMKNFGNDRDHTGKVTY